MKPETKETLKAVAREAYKVVSEILITVVAYIICKHL